MVFEPVVRAALAGLQVGSDVLMITWLDRADRDVLVVHPRGDLSRPATVCSTPDHPTGPIRSVCTESPFWPSTDCGCRSGTWKPSTEPQWWT